MTQHARNLQPGPIFYDVFLGALRVFGASLKDWSADRGVDPTNAKGAAHGSWNGPKARELRRQMVETVGEETFVRLYFERLEREEKKGAA